MFGLLRTLLLVGELLVAVSALGWLPWRLLPYVRTLVPVWVGAPFLGIGILQIYGWFWLEYSGRGLRSGLVVLALVWVAAVVVAAVVLRRRLLPPRPARSAVVGVSAVVLAVIVAVVLFLPGAFGDHDPLPTGLGNVDVVSYAITSEHIADSPYSDPGGIDGGDLGRVGRLDAAGPLVVLTTASVVSDEPVYLSVVPVMAMAIVLLALAATWVARLLLPRSWAVGAVVGAATVTPYCFGYIVGQYFLTQVLSMAAMVVLLGVYMVAQKTRPVRVTAALGLAGALVLAPTLLSYPHMAVLSQGIIVPVAYLSQSPRDWLRRWLPTLVVVAVTLGVGAVLIAPALGDIVERARLLASVDAGWPLPLISPFGALGAMRAPSMIVPTAGWPTSVVWWGQAVVLLGLGLLAAVRRLRDGAAWPLFPLFGSLAVLVSYRLVFASKGYSYQQWKWLTFFLPILTLAVLCAVVYLGQALLCRVSAPSGLRYAIAAVAAVVWFGATLSATRTLSEQQWVTLNPDLSELAELRGSGLTDVAVSLDPYWESMWAAYFLEPLHTSLQNPSYYGVSPGPGPWVLVRRSSESGAVESVPINDLYALVCRAEPCGPAPTLPQP